MLTATQAGFSTADREIRRYLELTRHPSRKRLSKSARMLRWTSTWTTLKKSRPRSRSSMTLCCRAVAGQWLAVLRVNNQVRPSR